MVEVGIYSSLNTHIFQCNIVTIENDMRMTTMMLNALTTKGASSVTSESENDETPESVKLTARVTRPTRPLIRFTLLCI